jgi:cyanophycin synthetase
LSVLSIERIDVGETRIEALVRVVDPRFDRTSAAPGLAERAVALLPGLARHTCENGTAHGMIAELADTETPHLLEHVACEIMSLAGSPRTLRAETVWDFNRDGRGVYRVRLGYDDDLVALASLRGASAVVDWLLDPGAAAETRPDVEAIVGTSAAARAIR